jgi:ribosomal protein L7/L12
MTPHTPEFLSYQLLNPGSGADIDVVYEAAEQYAGLLTEEQSQHPDLYPSHDPTVTRSGDRVQFVFSDLSVVFHVVRDRVTVTSSFKGRTFPLCWDTNSLSLERAVAAEIHRALFCYLGHDKWVPPEELCTVMLTAIGLNKIGVIREIREILNLGLLESKNLVESTPVVVTKAPREEALLIIKRLGNVGAGVRLEDG